MPTQPMTGCMGITHLDTVLSYASPVADGISGWRGVADLRQVRQQHGARRGGERRRGDADSRG